MRLFLKSKQEIAPRVGYKNLLFPRRYYQSPRTPEEITFAPMEANALKRKLEIIWWSFTLLAVVAVLLPIWLQTHDYPFYMANALYIVIFITFSRYTFFLKHTFIARMFWPKFLILAGGAITTFILLMSLGDFSNYLEEKGLQTLVDDLPIVRQYSIMRYIQGEMIFFGIASTLSAIALPLRMLISIYRMYNHGTV